MEDLRLFLDFLKDYFLTRITSLGASFEAIKDVIVAFLIVKRGKYSSSFLSSSVLLIVAAVLIAGPVITQNSPFVSQTGQSGSYQAAIISYNPYQGSLSTVVSVKSRSEIENYTVHGGDTLAGIAKRFNISVDTIKWANDLKSETIKPGQSLKIPPITGIVHTVQPGETVYSIAKKYRVDAQNIVNYIWNDFADPDTFALTPGQILYVPDGVIETAPAPTRLFAQVISGVKGNSNFIWPTTGVITQYPVWYHMALDIANPSMPAIIAADTGTVIYAGWNSTGYGNMVMIDHGNGYRTLYGHMSQILVSIGQAVSQGQQIGVMGSTGRSTGTHLHFEIRAGETLLNPLNFLK
ncbi:peptidoglycan DD-metalloendopeptidase family protein [Patescibacteria group bacterium]|nr:peptidoglycan DD-metalloendopeptidase family protein [Patescibacteria group bacterium]